MGDKNPKKAPKPKKPKQGTAVPPKGTGRPA